jgi:heterogeneous nuclear ribonucleoprotein R
MPSTKGNGSAAAEQAESEKPVEYDEKVDLDEDYDPEEMMDEEVEYEEVEEIVEEEVEEEEIIEEEEEVEVEEEDDDDASNANAGDETKVEGEDEQKKYDELLARPPHGSEVYIGGIPNDASEEDLRDFCESVGEVTEVSSTSTHEASVYMIFVRMKTLANFMTTGSNYERKRFK